MATPAGYPLFPSPPNYKVSISLPMKGNSEISKSVGIENSNPLMVPNIEYLKKFSTGDVGLSDKIQKESLLKSLNDPIATKDERVFKKFGDVSGFDTTDSSKYKKDGKIKVNKEDITPPKNDGTGLKAFEKTALTSVFETQKPYMEVNKMVVTNMVKMEDIVARVMPLIGIPLVTKSAKPKGNPKAMGYNSGKEMSDALSKLQSIAKSGTEVKIDKDGNVTRTKQNSATQSIVNTTNWKIISTEYSTGVFKPGVDYKYVYVDLPADKYPEENYDLKLDDDPYSNYKPKNIILGIFHNDGTPLNPSELLKTFGVSGNNIIKENTIYPLADWVLKSPKWKFPTGVYQWPSFETPTFLKDQGGNILRYNKDQKNVLTNDTAIEGNPIILEFSQPATTEYATYFNDHIKFKMNQADGLEQVEKDQYSKDIIGKVNIPSHMENVFLYGQNKSSVYKDSFPNLMKTSFRPYQLYSAEVAADPKLAAYAKSKGEQPGYMWIDPESDYEMKIIRVDPTTKIKYEDGKEVSKVESTIKSFIKNKTTFKISNDTNFDIYVKKNEEDPIRIEGVPSYTLDNWNYFVTPSGPVVQNNSYLITIHSKTPSKYYSNINDETISNTGYWTELIKDNNIWSYKEYTKDNFGKKIYRNVEDGNKILTDNSKVYVKNSEISYWVYLDNKLYDKANLPVFNREKVISVNYEGNLELLENDVIIPNYLLKVTSSEFPYGKIIDPSKITNDELKKKELFSTGKYGVGDTESPQEIGVIQRYMLTDLDTESYYIIEGVLTDNNTQTGDPVNNASAASSSNSGGSYRLPHAIGATKIFIYLLVDIFALLIPAIVKLLKLLKKPNNFITETVSEKAGNGFSFLSKESTNTYKSSKNINYTSKSDKVKKTKKVIDNSKLKNYVYVNNKGDSKFLLDGSSKIPLNILGTSQTLGMGLNYDNENPISSDSSSATEQPLLKMLLGIVTFPMKIIAGILEWIMDFFKSLSNPLSLPSKIVEFISFSWIMKFFTPNGILGLLGIKFQPSKVPEWTGGSSDADFDSFLSMPSMSKLPRYTNKQIKKHPDRPFKIMWPLFGFIEKIVNIIIDLIWAIIGIECIIPAPHINLSSSSANPGQSDADNLKKETDKPGFPSDPKADARLGNKSVPGTEGYLYDITLSDGSVVKGLNYSELQKYIKENEDLNYDFKF